MNSLLLGLANPSLRGVAYKLFSLTHLILFPLDLFKSLSIHLAALILSTFWKAINSQGLSLDVDFTAPLL